MQIFGITSLAVGFWAQPSPFKLFYFWGWPADCLSDADLQQRHTKSTNTLYCI